jgi:hypothetical protein
LTRGVPDVTPDESELAAGLQVSPTKTLNRGKPC